MLRRKPTLLEVRLEDKEELVEARQKAAAVVAAQSSSPSFPSPSKSGSGTSALLNYFDSKGSVPSRIGFNH